MNAVQITRANPAPRRSKLKHILRIAAWSAAAMLAVAILARAAIVASQTEGGWQILGDHLIAGLPPGLSKPISQLEIDSKKWVLEQANRVLTEPSSSACELMGAALVTQSVEYGAFNWGQPNIAQIGCILWSQWPQSSHSDVTLEDLNASLLFKMGQLASRAVALEPADINWRRMQAWMNLSWSGPERVDPAVLEAARAVDPENALYDYFLGVHAFDKAFTMRAHPERGMECVIEDLAEYEKSRQHFSRGFAKPLLGVGERGLECAGTFMLKARGPLPLRVVACDARYFFDLRGRLILFLEDPFYRDHPPPDYRRFISWEELPIYLWFTAYNPESFWQRQLRASGENLAFEIFYYKRWFFTAPTRAATSYFAARGIWEPEEFAAWEAMGAE